MGLPSGKRATIAENLLPFLPNNGIPDFVGIFDTRFTGSSLPYNGIFDKRTTGRSLACVLRIVIPSVY
jgi:hypothetical protein